MRFLYSLQISRNNELIIAPPNGLNNRHAGQTDTRKDAMTRKRGNKDLEQIVEHKAD
jgi:hypothetical protein